MTDVSPDFRYNRIDAVIIARVAKHWESPKAIRAFSNHHRPLTDYGYWYLLGTLWVSYSGHSDLELWKRFFRSTRPMRDTSLMKPSELALWRELPEVLTLYRAHRPNETDWIAYTLSPTKAAQFSRSRYNDEVVAYEVDKADALCLFTRRGESEVLVLDRTKARRKATLKVVLV